MSRDRIDRRRALQWGIGSAFGAGATWGTAQDKVNPGNRPPRPAPPTGRRPAEGGEFFGTNERLHVRTGGTETGDWFREDARDIPLRRDFDVIVCGGGPAGIAAALSAARSGAKVGLIEVNGCLGGIWTAGLLSWILDAVNKGGIMAELVARIEATGIGRRVERAWVYDAEPLKVLLEEMLLDAGVTVRLHTRVVGAAVDETNRLSTVLTESKSGREAWSAQAFVDSTGDGDLAAQAGCAFEFGRPGDGVTQPFSLIGILSGVETDGIARFIRGPAEERGLGSPKRNLLEEFRRAGIEPSYGGPTIFEIREGLYAMMANHQYGASAVHADEVTAATIEARREVHAMVAALRQLGGPWKDLHLNNTAEQIGTREGRRVLGRYYVDSDDLKTGAEFEDNICQVTFPIDVHSTDPAKTKAIESKPFRSQPYQIPLRALVARDVDGLMLAGRCISGDFIAHSSYRVTGNAVAMGEAAGAVSALAVREKALPHEIPFSALEAEARAAG